MLLYYLSFTGIQFCPTLQCLKLSEMCYIQVSTEGPRYTFLASFPLKQYL
uniref:Uncharacterized protein n=1 Tax=Turnera subulata TaxID=218843 RepID=A0A516IJK0_9ROSI